jgi:hypothetical protein
MNELAGKAERSRQDQYWYNQLSTIGQMNPMPVGDFQPTAFNQYAKLGGTMFSHGGRKFSNDAEFNMDVYAKGGQVSKGKGQAMAMVNFLAQGGLTAEGILDFLFEEEEKPVEKKGKEESENTAPTEADIAAAARRQMEKDDETLALAIAEEDFEDVGTYRSRKGNFNPNPTAQETKKGVYELFYNDPNSGEVFSRKHGKDLGKPVSGHSDHLHFAADASILDEVVPMLKNYGLQYSEGYDKGAKKGVHKGTSYHYRQSNGKRLAIDVNHPDKSKEPEAINKFINEVLRPRGLYKYGGKSK